MSWTFLMKPKYKRLHTVSLDRAQFSADRPTQLVVRDYCSLLCSMRPKDCCTFPCALCVNHTVFLSGDATDQFDLVFLRGHDAQVLCCSGMPTTDCWLCSQLSYVDACVVRPHAPTVPLCCVQILCAACSCKDVIQQQGNCFQ